LSIQADIVDIVFASAGCEDAIDTWCMLLARRIKRAICYIISTMDGKTFILTLSRYRCAAERKEKKNGNDKKEVWQE